MSDEWDDLFSNLFSSCSRPSFSFPLLLAGKWEGGREGRERENLACPPSVKARATLRRDTALAATTVRKKPWVGRGGGGGTSGYVDWG